MGNKVSGTDMDVTEISPGSLLGSLARMEAGDAAGRRRRRRGGGELERRRKRRTRTRTGWTLSDWTSVAVPDQVEHPFPRNLCCPNADPNVCQSLLLCFHPSESQYQGVHVSMRCPRSGIVVSIRLLELISKIRDRGRFHQRL